MLVSLKGILKLRTKARTYALEDIWKTSSFQHSLQLEINVGSRKFVHPRVDSKHLLHCLVATRSSPRFFDSFDMFIFE